MITDEDRCKSTSLNAVEEKFSLGKPIWETKRYHNRWVFNTHRNDLNIRFLATVHDPKFHFACGVIISLYFDCYVVVGSI